MKTKAEGIRDFKFSEETAYRGRNGKGRQLGMGVQAYEMGEAKIVVLNPINSRNCVSDAAVLRIPEADVPKLIEALKGVTGKTGMSIEEIRAIEDKVLERWESRRKAQGYSKTTKTGLQYQTEFLMGMVAVTDILFNSETESSISPRVMFSIMRGDYVEAPTKNEEVKS